MTGGLLLPPLSLIRDFVVFQGSSWALTVVRSDFFLQVNLGELTVRFGEIIVQNYGIFHQFGSKLAITHTIAIKWKEKQDAVVTE